MIKYEKNSIHKLKKINFNEKAVKSIEDDPNFSWFISITKSPFGEEPNIHSLFDTIEEEKKNVK